MAVSDEKTAAPCHHFINSNSRKSPSRVRRLACESSFDVLFGTIVTSGLFFIGVSGLVETRLRHFRYSLCLVFLC
jgi:hypothetical protein